MGEKLCRNFNLRNTLNHFSIKKSQASTILYCLWSQIKVVCSCLTTKNICYDFNENVLEKNYIFTIAMGKVECITHLKRAYEGDDRCRMISSLLEIKKHVRGGKNITDVDKETLGILINLIKNPNGNIMDLSMGILANCCLCDGHRELFSDLGGVPPLALVIQAIDKDSILCRAYRLVGNLACNINVALVLNEHNIGHLLLKSLGTVDNKSPDTLMMTFRALRKLWADKSYRTKMLSEDVTTNLSNCLNSSDNKIVQLSIETLILFSTVNNLKCNYFKVSKGLLSKLVELYHKEEFSHLAMNCLSNLICYQTNQVWKYLEGSKIPEVFINYVNEQDTINHGVLKAFYKLCTEGAVRSKVKVSGLLPKLIKLCTGSNVDRILPIFYLFQFDVSSIRILAQEKEFISLLTQNITKDGAVRLLSVVSRLHPPVMELLREENLNIIIGNKECHCILRKMLHTKVFLNRLIVSGRIWELSNANCLSHDQEQCTEYTEALLVHILRTGERHERENAALAVPFLVKPRYSAIFNTLAHNDGITIILRLLRERTLEEGVLASVVKLIHIFQESFNYLHKHSIELFESSDIKNKYHHHDKVENRKCDVSVIDPAFGREKSEIKETVTFEMDCGSLVTVDRILLCDNSPVVDAMLNGDFMESNQQKVKLSCCSAEALLNLEKLLKKEENTGNLNIETHLELISLTDRFLMPDLNYSLTARLPVNESSCVAVLQWCKNSGDLESKMIIKQRVYDFVFSSSSHLLIVMKNDTLRSSVVEEITKYLSETLKQLL